MKRVEKLMTDLRPTTVVEGTYRNYIAEDNRVKIDQYKNGEWVNVVDTPYTEDDNGTVGINGKWY